ncbi:MULTISPECIES: SDR family NAD(P)-dependent oxidoreductase [Nostoc]|uniref:SDR family NAD(P)-dependent oxidoreductase n=2 Tax=Nostoc TaxID=1177 RepID=A0ABR8I6D1_9NOSO|nr:MULTISPECIES: SDR family NAD(P)-dependent oxidoreductase [Nostoc]MBD2560451.1 SDR family NAD(P)-dependent oxidoreductase [Nostoc linckia FACHB-391]MBD2646955.1 SDR family NAD(P)-dependent oxidoreductase [Nostoc foliaceum FACHB-393]
MQTQTSKSDKTVIITGGNKGLGYYCAKAIATLDPNSHVIIASRNQKQAALSAKRLIAQTGNKSIEALLLDLASLTSIRTFVKDFAVGKRPPLRAIVCNAGTQVVTGTTYTQDGFETTFGVNHLGHFLLVNLLLQHLVSPARILFVTSGTHFPNDKPNQTLSMPSPDYRNAWLLAFPDLASTQEEEDAYTIGRQRYTTSKLCNILCAYELSHRLQSQGYSNQQHPITVNTFDPGLMPGTGIIRDYDLIKRFAWTFLLPGFRLFAPYVNTTNKSGKDLAKLILDHELAGVTGKYFVGLRQVSSSDESYDRKKAVELWDTSAELVNLTPDETILQSPESILD